MSDSDEFGGLGATTPHVPRTKPFVGESKLNKRAVTSAEAGPSKPTRAQLAAFGSRKTARVHEVDDEDEGDIREVEASVRGNGKRKESSAVEDEDDDEVQEVDPPRKTIRTRGGSRKPSSTVNGKPTSNGTDAAATKRKAKAKPPPKIGPPRGAPRTAREPMVDSNDVVELDADVNGAADIADVINAAIKSNAGRAPKIQPGQQNDDGTRTQLEEQLRQEISRNDTLTKQFDELCQIRKTEPELLLERMEEQYKRHLESQEALIANLNSQLARKDPIHRTDQQVFEILTREEANREMHTLQAEVDEWKKRCQDVEKKLAQKNEEISTLQRSQNDLRVELQAEIERGKVMSSKLQRMPPLAPRSRTGNGLSSADDPKLAEIIKFYEDLTNLIVPSMKLQKGKFFDTDEWVLNCVYSFTDEAAQKQKPLLKSRTISFILRLCLEPPSEFKGVVESERQLVETVHYVPQNLDKESVEFRESLEFLNTTFTFERSQLALFIRTLYMRMNDEDSDDNKSEDDVQIIEKH